MTENWQRALQSYSYPVDLRKFEHAQEYPGWFEHNLPWGSREETIEFEDHFRENAQSALAPWFEVVFWKMYSQGGRANYRTQCVVEQMEDNDVSPQQLWDACEQYTRSPSRKAFDNFRKLFHFTSESIAIVATFPAFMAPKWFPMVDSRVADWTRENAAAHNEADPDGPELIPPQKGYLTMRHWPFVLSWVKWCFHTSQKLTARTNTEWRARDVEMAVWSAYGKIQLEPLPG